MKTNQYKTVIPLTALVLGCSGAAQNASEIKVAAPVVNISPLEELPTIKEVPLASEADPYAKYNYLKSKSLPALIDKLKGEMKRRNIEVFFSYPYGKYECGFSIGKESPTIYFQVGMNLKEKTSWGLYNFSPSLHFREYSISAKEWYAVLLYEKLSSALELPYDNYVGDVINLPAKREISIIVREALYHINKLEPWGEKGWNSYVYNGDLSPDFTTFCDFVVGLQKKK